jgi:hypothetical protein
LFDNVHFARFKLGLPGDQSEDRTSKHRNVSEQVVIYVFLFVGVMCFCLLVLGLHVTQGHGMLATKGSAASL